MTTADARITAAEPRASSAELRAQDSRDEILKAATALFANRGFHETSMSEVAKAASVSKALIFWHFKTKEDLFMAVLSGLLEPYFIDFTEEAGALDEKAQIIRLIELYLLFVRDNAGSIRFFVAQLLHDERPSDGLANQVMQLYDGYRTLLVDLIGRAQNNFVCIRDFPPLAVANMLLATLNGLLIGFLFTADQAVQVESAVSMIRQWLFHDGPQVGLPPSL
ncbi:MAG: TetR/AcrR family transcriptional regulator [Candidatus Binataceae bacterium]|nr:TetR/AcrR family transcriptional regulator [Candidatus Binataceae bacterium]